MLDIINENLIKLDIESNNKEDVIKILASLINNEERLNNYNEYIKEVFCREKSSTTGIGSGIAIPHGKCSAVKIPTVAVGRISSGVEWDSFDGDSVQVVFLLAVPEDAESDNHLRILAALCRKLLDEKFRESLLNCVDQDRISEILLKEFNNFV